MGLQFFLLIFSLSAPSVWAQTEIIDSVKEDFQLLSSLTANPDFCSALHLTSENCLGFGKNINQSTFALNKETNQPILEMPIFNKGFSLKVNSKIWYQHPQISINEEKINKKYLFPTQSSAILQALVYLGFTGQAGNHLSEHDFKKAQEIIIQKTFEETKNKVEQFSKKLAIKLNTYLSLGYLNLSTEELNQLIKVSDPEHAQIKVQLHACIVDPKGDSLSECLHPEEERTIINDPYHENTIIVGYARFKEIKDPFELAHLLLHEWLEFAFSNTKTVRDSHFQESNQFKEKISQDWQIYKLEIKKDLKEFRILTQDFAHFDYEILTSYLAELKQKDPNYLRCQKLRGKKDNEFICQTWVNHYFQMQDNYLNQDLNGNVRENLEKTKKWLKNKDVEIHQVNADPDWVDFRSNKINNAKSCIADAIQDFYHETSSSDTQKILFSTCPDLWGADLVSCFANQYMVEMNKFISGKTLTLKNKINSCVDHELLELKELGLPLFEVRK